MISASPLMNHKLKQYHQRNYWVFVLNQSWAGPRILITYATFSQRLGILQRIRHNLTYVASLAFYNCLLLSLMDYCCVVWSNLSKGNLNRIRRLQKKAARLMLDRESKAPSLPLFLELGWLPIQNRIKLTRSAFLNGLSPRYISDLIQWSFSKIHHIGMRGVKRNLKLPKANSNSDKRTFAFLPSSERNLPPDSVKTSTSLS